MFSRQDIEYESTKLLKQAGLNSVILATDNFSQPVLDRYKKLTSVKQNLDSIKDPGSVGCGCLPGHHHVRSVDHVGRTARKLGNPAGSALSAPLQILSKLEVYYGSPITLELEKLGLLDKDGYLYRYRFLDERIQGVYLAIENLMKILHPSMIELDSFRWEIQRFCRG